MRLIPFPCKGRSIQAAGHAREVLTTDEALPGAQPDASGQSWVELAAHNFSSPINTMWSEGELAFADDGTMVFTKALLQ